MIELRHVEKAFRDSTPLKDVNVTINDGDVISVIGPSGTGKSTLLRCINMLGAPTKGQIIVDGEDITAKGYDIRRVRRKMGMVFQSFNLFGHLNVIENVMVAPMDLLGVSAQDAYDNGMKLLADVGLASKALNRPDQLSGGQKQRVAIARTLAMDPSIILFDEPTSALDPAMVDEVQSVISDLARSGKTMMIVTHEMKFARQICNRVFYMDEGGVYEDGTPEQIFGDPQKEKTRRFINRLKVMHESINSKDYDFLAMYTRLNEYVYKSRIDLKPAYRIHQVIEELCQQILLPVLPAEPMIDLVIEHAENAGTVITVRYNGQPFDPKDTENQLSYKIIMSAAKSIRYRIRENDELHNVISLTIE